MGTVWGEAIGDDLPKGDVCRHLHLHARHLDRTGFNGNGGASSSGAFGFTGPMQMRSMLIVFAGLPGTGRSSVARELAGKLDAVWLRIDSIQQAIWGPGFCRDQLTTPDIALCSRSQRTISAWGVSLLLTRSMIGWLPATRGATSACERAPAWSRLRSSARTHRSIVGALKPAQSRFRARCARLGGCDGARLSPMESRSI